MDNYSNYRRFQKQTDQVGREPRKGNECFRNEWKWGILIHRILVPLLESAIEIEVRFSVAM